MHWFINRQSSILKQASHWVFDDCILIALYLDTLTGYHKEYIKILIGLTLKIQSPKICASNTAQVNDASKNMLKPCQCGNVETSDIKLCIWDFGYGQLKQKVIITFIPCTFLPLLEHGNDVSKM